MNVSVKVPAFSLSVSSWLLLLAMVQGLLLTGCSSHSARMVDQVEQQSSDQQRIDQVLSALQVTEARLAKAQADHVETYAPDQMAQARSALAEARRYAERFQADPDNVNKSISLFFGDSMGGQALSLLAQANEALSRAEANKRQADSIFAEANENFTWLKKFQAPVHFRYEYQELERAQKSLVEYVADGRSDKAVQGLPRLLQRQQALEIAAAQRFYLYELSRQVEWHEHALVGRYAALSYSNALGALNKANRVVAQNSRDEAAILAAKREAEFSLAIASAVAADMQKLVNMDRQSMERWLILLTTKLHTMAGAIGADDVRDQELMTQVDLLTAAAQHNKDGQPAGRPTAQKAESELVAEAEKGAVKEVDKNTDKGTANQAATEEINQRVAELEQSLEAKVKALTEQLQAIQAANQRAEAQAEPAAEPEL
jgi:hypothetical protein|tara:strand:- start:3152 stop:4441 length:1290 start_codon:yes stop_codon:yes gene_type:complete